MLKEYYIRGYMSSQKINTLILKVCPGGESRRRDSGEK